MSAQESSATGVRRIWWWVAGAAVVVAAVVVALVLHGGSSDAAAPAPLSSDTAAVTPSATPVGPPATTAPPTTAPTSSAAAPASTPAPHPSVSVPVPPIDNRKPTEAPAGTTAQSGGVSVSIASFESVGARGSGPGEFSGPGVAVKVQIHNDGSKTFDASAVTVSVYAGAAGTPLVTVDTDPSYAPVKDVPAGKTETGTYVFGVSDPNQTFAVFVDLTPSAAPVVFQGLHLG